MTQDRIVIPIVAEPADIAAFPLAPDKPIFRFPVIRDPRWKGALDSLAKALELRPSRDFRSGLKSSRGANDSVLQECRDFSNPAIHAVHCPRDVEFKDVWSIAYRYCLIRERTILIAKNPEHLKRQVSKRRERGLCTKSICLWGVARDFSFDLIEKFEETIHTLNPVPFLAYMVAEDARQLMWLAFKTLVLWHVAPKWPDGFLRESFQYVRDLSGETRRIASDDTGKALKALQEKFDYLGMTLHGRGYEASLSREPAAPATFCTQRVGQLRNSTDRSIMLGPRCSLEETCFQDDKYGKEAHEKMHVWKLHARVLFMSSCASWRIGDSDTNYSATLAIRALDGFCTAYVGSRYEKHDEPLLDYKVIAAWKAGLTIGEAVRFANVRNRSVGHSLPDRLQLLSLLGDPEQKRLQGVDKGYDDVDMSSRQGRLEVKGVRGATIAVETTKLRNPADHYKIKEGGGRGTESWTASGLGRAGKFEIYLLEIPDRRHKIDLTLDPAGLETDSPVYRKLPADVSKWVTTKLLKVADTARDVADAARVYRDLAQGTWLAYGKEYWPGPVEQYETAEDGPVWLGDEIEYKLCDPCPGCQLPTMRTISSVKACLPRTVGDGGTIFLKVVDVYCPRCYQVGYFPMVPYSLGMPSFKLLQGSESGSLLEVKDGRVSRNGALFVEVAFPDDASDGALWIAVTPSERHVTALPALPEPDPLFSTERKQIFRLQAQCLQPGIHHIRTYFCRRSHFALSASGRMVHVI